LELVCSAKDGRHNMLQEINPIFLFYFNTTAFESILDSAVRDEESTVDEKTFKTAVVKLKQIIEQGLTGKIESQDIKSLLISLENINRR
jgi:hypothetical protein